MSTPTHQPKPMPASPPSGNARRAAGVTVLGGAATVGALTFVAAPWWAVAATAGLSIVMAGLILVVQATFPDNSEHRRDLWLAWVQYWDRRAVRKAQRDRAAARRTAAEVRDSAGPSSRPIAPVPLRTRGVQHDR